MDIPSCSSVDFTYATASRLGDAAFSAECLGLGVDVLEAVDMHQSRLAGCGWNAHSRTRAMRVRQLFRSSTDRCKRCDQERESMHDRVQYEEPRL